MEERTADNYATSHQKEKDGTHLKGLRDYGLKDAEEKAEGL